MDYKNYIQLSLSQGVNFSIGKAIKDGFSMFGKNAGSYIGFLIVMFFISIAAGLFGMFIPFIGGIAVGVLVTPALLMGFAIFARKQILGENPAFETFFEGFKTNYMQLILVNLVLQLIQYGLLAILLIPIFGDLLLEFQDPSIIQNEAALQEIFQEMAINIMAKWWMFFLYIIFSIVIQILYMLANYYVIFYNFSFWEAMESSRHLMSKVFFKAFILNILVGFIVVIGSFATLFIGLLFLIPISFLINFSLFNQIAGFADQEQSIEDDLII